MTTRPYIERLSDPLLAQLLTELPAVLLAGPRASGKTTTAMRHVHTVVRLDRPSEAAAMALDPDAVLDSFDEPVLLDEWQVVPQVLGAVKRAVDRDRHPGRFVLTGSAQSDALAAGWPATGRLVRISHWGLTRRELAGNAHGPSIFDLLFDDQIERLRVPVDPPTLRTYLEMALVGGFPDSVLQPSPSGRRRWLNSYVDQLLTRDAALVSERRDPRRLRRYLHALAANTAGIVDHKALYDAAGISRMTALAYDALLDLVMVTEQVPAWSTNRFSRLVRSPKRYLVDPALLGPLLGIDERAALRDAGILGRVIDSFVLAQLRPEVDAASVAPTIYHLREEHGRREVDLVIEAPDGRIVGIEIKASAAPDRRDAEHLVWLRDRLGDRFTYGIVFHTGPRHFPMDDRIHALPICAIWGS